MSNQKLVGTRMVHEISQAGKKIQILQTRFVDQSPPCRTCNKEKRQQGSSRCAKCSTISKVRKLNDEQLQEKIVEQSGQLLKNNK